MEDNITKEIELKKAPTLKTLITIMTILLTTASILAVVMIGYYNLNQMFQNMVKDKCNNMVQMMSLYVDAEKLNESILKYDAEDPYLAELQQKLYQVKEKTNAQYIYIIVQNGEYVEYIVDGSCAVTDPDYMPLGGLEPIEDYDGVEDAFSTGNIITSDLYVYEDANGDIYNLIGGYYPIKSSDGKLIAVLGGDISVNQNIEELEKIISEFIIAFFVLVVISGAVAILVCMRLFGPLSRIVGHIRELSKGDFTIQYKYNKNDETGKINQSLAYLVNSLKKMFAVIVGSAGSLGETAKVLDDSTEQIAISIQGVNFAVGNIAASAGEQTEYAGMGMESMEGLNKNIGLNISNLEELISTLKKVALCKDDGLHSIESLKQQSAASGETLRKMGVDIGKTNDSVSHIGAASTTIKNIASQTNLLALNASIEAARAGESGKGFAVVAEEIRKLSEESNASADEISNVIEVLIKNSENMVATMEEMSRSMAEQTGSVSHTEESFEQISRTIDSTNESLENLSASTVSMEKVEKELSSVFNKIKESIDNNAAASEEVSASMQEQTAIIEEIAGRAKQLTAETEKLGDSLKVFSF